MKPPTWPEIAGALRRPRNRVLLGLLVLGLAVRIALPYVLRPLIVSQADAALVGRIALADLDLSLIRGGVTLHGLEVHVDELPAPGAPRPRGGSDPARLRSEAAVDADQLARAAHARRSTSRSSSSRASACGSTA